jgi:tetratricopeptide (TPR) repeat protein
VRAGLSILDALSKSNQQTSFLDVRTSQTRLLGSAGALPSVRPKLSARIGIDSGAVVVGRGAGKDADVFGEAPNIAAHVQALAPSDAVLITAATHRLVSGLFVAEDRGAQAFKGTDRPIHVYRVIQPSGVRGRLEAAAATRGLTPFVGREEELRLLLNRWERALDGEGQVALIVGEAGIGKSRLLQHFHQQVMATPHTWAEAAAAPSFQNTPFYPVADLLRQLALPHAGEPADEQLTQLEPHLTAAGLKPAEAIPLIAPLLNLPLAAKYPPLAYSPEQQRRRLLAMLVEWVLGAARVQPLVIATEDLHWADPSTLELIQVLVEQGTTGRLLLLYTGRPEFRPQWPLRAHHTQITLNRLSMSNVRVMVERVAARKALSDETVAAVIERTGGVPLFVEELTRVVLETGNEKLTGREIPVTLHDSLMARLDRLGPAKDIAQIGAVIGSEFSYELISAVHPIPENDLRQALRSLTDADLLYVRGIAPEASYQFKHALIRDAAYEALLKSRRKELHRQVARAIEQRFAALKETDPELLAHHWTEADETERAIAEWERAGKAAEARQAFREAEAFYRKALALLNVLPESHERDVQELVLRLAVDRMFSATTGGTQRQPEAVAAAEHILTLARKSGTFSQIVESMINRGFRAFQSGDLAQGAAIAEEAFALAVREGTSHTLLPAHMLRIWAFYFLGDLYGVEKHFAAALQLFKEPELSDFSAMLITPVAYASYNAWFLGRAEVARERAAQIEKLAKPKDHYGQALTKVLAGFLQAQIGEFEQAETSEASVLEMAEEHEFPVLASLARIGLGYARARLSRASEGVALIRKGIEDQGKFLSLARYMTWLAEAHERAGALAVALETAERVLELNPGVLLYRPETLRVRGELRLKSGQAELAEADFHNAIALAQKIGAEAWELRATMSLARMLTSRGQCAEARSVLAEIYNWFTEGFDTADLKEAKALLDELRA